MYDKGSNRSCFKQKCLSISERFEIYHLCLKNMQTGTIARLNNGYGFITREDGEKDLFFHASELSGVEFNDLREGDKLEFEVAEGPKGLNAVNVSLVK